MYGVEEKKMSTKVPDGPACAELSAAASKSAVSWAVSLDNLRLEREGGRDMVTSRVKMFLTFILFFVVVPVGPDSFKLPHEYSAPLLLLHLAFFSFFRSLPFPLPKCLFENMSEALFEIFC